MSKSKLTPEQIKEIAFSELSLNKLAEIYSTSRHTIIVIKNEHGTSRGRGRGTRSTGYKVSDEQKAEIVASPLTYAELALKYQVHESTIGKIKRKAGVFVKRRNHNRSKLVLTDAMVERIKDLTISARSLSDEIGISAESISRQRKKLGLSFREYRRTLPKKKREYKTRQYIPRPGKEKIPAAIKIIVKKLKSEVKAVKNIKDDTPKEIVKKLKSEVKRAAMVKNKFEEANIEKARAVKAKMTYQELEAKQKELGYRWVTGVCERGIKKQVWTNK